MTAPEGTTFNIQLATDIYNYHLFSLPCMTFMLLSESSSCCVLYRIAHLSFSVVALHDLFMLSELQVVSVTNHCVSYCIELMLIVVVALHDMLDSLQV